MSEELTVWDYLNQIKESTPGTADRVDALLKAKDEAGANELLHAVWSMFENEGFDAGTGI